MSHSIASESPSIAYNSVEIIGISKWKFASTAARGWCFSQMIAAVGARSLSCKLRLEIDAAAAAAAAAVVFVCGPIKSDWLANGRAHESRPPIMQQTSGSLRRRGYRLRAVDDTPMMQL